jgi:hypothetical protein
MMFNMSNLAGLNSDSELQRAILSHQNDDVANPPQESTEASTPPASIYGCQSAQLNNQNSDQKYTDSQGTD